MTTPEHEHRWARDNALTGQACMDCQASGWDWHVDEVRRLRVEIVRRDEEIKDWENRLIDALDTQLGLREEIDDAHAALDSKAVSRRCLYDGAPLSLGGRIREWWSLVKTQNEALQYVRASIGATADDLLNTVKNIDAVLKDAEGR